MATLSVQNINITGLNPSFAAAAGGGDDFPNDGSKTFFVCKNGGGGPITATFDDTGSVSPTGASAFDADVAVTVPAGEERWCGPFSTVRFTGSVAVTYSGVSSVTVAAVKLA